MEMSLKQSKEPISKNVMAAGTFGEAFRSLFLNDKNEMGKRSTETFFWIVFFLHLAYISNGKNKRMTIFTSSR